MGGVGIGQWWSTGLLYSGPDPWVHQGGVGRYPRIFPIHGAPVAGRGVRLLPPSQQRGAPGCGNIVQCPLEVPLALAGFPVSQMVCHATGGCWDPHFSLSCSGMVGFPGLDM